MTEAEMALALGSTVVHSRKSDLKDVFGEDLFDTKPGKQAGNGTNPRKLYRLRRGVSIRDGEA